MEKSYIREKLLRFERCDKKFFPYLENVLERLPEEIAVKEVLEDVNFQIISTEFYWHGLCVQFPNPVKNIVVLNELTLKYLETQIIYTIVHEIGHKVLRGRRDDLSEMLVEDLMIKWGFEEEVKVKNSRIVKLERLGDGIGFKWACSQGKEYLISLFEFYDEWNEGRLTDERFSQLYSILNPKEIFNKREFLETDHSPKKVNYDDFLEQEKAILNKAITLGVFHVLDILRELP